MAALRKKAARKRAKKPSAPGFERPLDARVRSAVKGRRGVGEKRMFAPEGTRTQRQVDAWVARGLRYAQRLPPK